MRVAGIGCGYFSRFHYDAWARVEGAELVGLCDRDRDKAEAMAAGVAGPAVFTDAARMLDEVRPDLVDIVTPPATHLGLVELAAERGLTAICQKPLAPTLAEARRIVEVAERAGTLLVVHENFRWQPWFREVRRLIENGAVGDVMNLSFRLRPGDGQGPRAYLDRQPYFQQMPRFLIHETGIHFIDTFRFLLGEPSWVAADLRRLNPVIAGEDAGHFLMGFADGRRALFDGNRLVDHAADNTRLTMGEMLVEGTAGALRLDGFGRLFQRPMGGSEREHAYAWENRGFGGDCIFALQSYLVAQLPAGAEPVNTARAYLRNVEIEEAIYEAAETGRRHPL
jgi:predicted dehydrogenase